MRVGILGAGFMGKAHLAGWAETGAEIVGLASRTASGAAPLAAQYGAEAFPDLESLLPLVDIVDICTPTHLHYAMTLQAIRAGRHVVCEKPLARTTEQARHMLQAARAAGVRLLPAHVVRFFPQYVNARNQVMAGEIGKPGVIRLLRGFYRPKKPVGNWFLDEEKSGGILMDLMIHDYDYARWIAGEVESVYARKITGYWPEAPVEYGLAILKHRSGALTHAAGAWAYPPPAFRTSLEIFGEGGLLAADAGNDAPVNDLLDMPPAEAPDIGLPVTEQMEDPYTVQIQELYTAILEGRDCRVTAADGLAAVQIAEAAEQSARSGQAIVLDLLPEVTGDAEVEK